MPEMPDFHIQQRRVGGGAPPLVVAEVGQNHDGSLGLAHAFIDAAADAGSDAIKFQTHLADAESTLDEPFRVEFSRQDRTRYDYWKRMEFSPAEWRGLAEHSAERGLLFLSSAFSTEAVALLAELDLPAWKVGSGEFASIELLQAMTTTRRPILLSTGMSTFAEIDRVVDLIRGKGVPIAILQCTSRYPVGLEEVGLNVLDEFRRRYRSPVGLSDHSGSIWPAVTAMARGVDIVEVHMTLDRRMFGPDVSASLTVEELRLLVEARDAITTMNESPVDKDRMANAFRPMREMFAKSLAPVRDLTKETVLTVDLLTTKKPGTGIAPGRIDEVIGRRLVRDVPRNRLLRLEDFDA